MTLPVKLRDIFASEVTRPIAPVVWFHETSPDKLQAEVDEYIITGGWPEGERRRRVPNGIHEQAVKLLTAIAQELDRKDRVDLPVAWISGFYGSGKSSFAKLLGLALDRTALPGGRSLAAALLDRDTSPRRQELRDAWDRLLAKIEPMAVVFDLGACPGQRARPLRRRPPAPGPPEVLQQGRDRRRLRARPRARRQVRPLPRGRPAGARQALVRG